MGNSRLRARAATLAAALTIVGGAALATAPAASADDPIPPITCGALHHEIGPISSGVHALEPALLPIGMGQLTLAHVVHGVNCSVVLNVEYLLGLQQRPWTP